MQRPINSLGMQALAADTNRKAIVDQDSARAASEVTSGYAASTRTQAPPDAPGRPSSHRNILNGSDTYVVTLSDVGQAVPVGFAVLPGKP